MNHLRSSFSSAPYVLFFFSCSLHPSNQFVVLKSHQNSKLTELADLEASERLPVLLKAAQDCSLLCSWWALPRDPLRACFAVPPRASKEGMYVRIYLWCAHELCINTCINYLCKPSLVPFHSLTVCYESGGKGLLLFPLGVLQARADSWLPCKSILSSL